LSKKADRTMGVKMSAAQIGFIGVGRMGGPMASHLLAAGHELIVFDLDETALAAIVAKGARRAASVIEVASAAEIVFVSLPTPDIVQKVVTGEGGIARGNRVRTVVASPARAPAPWPSWFRARAIPSPRSNPCSRASANSFTAAKSPASHRR
jgi:hypothetical protein